MYYAKGNAIGIRRKFAAKNQVFSFGGTSCPLSQESLKSLAEDVLRKLDKGAKEATVKQWVDKAIREAS